MSYWLEDADGRYLGDLATNVGINQLRNAGSPALETFLDQGFADAELIEKIVNESTNNPKLSYIAALFDEVKAPVYVTDGCGQEDEVENVFCATGPGGGVDPTCKVGDSEKSVDKSLPLMSAPGTANAATSDEVANAKKMLHLLPSDLIQEAGVEHIELYSDSSDAAERIDAYLSENPGIGEAPEGGARGLFDRGNGHIIATTWVSEDSAESGRNIYHEFAHALSDRITDPLWEEPWVVEWRDYGQDEGFAEAFSEYWVSKQDPEMMSDLKTSKPKTVALFEEWGW